MWYGFGVSVGIGNELQPFCRLTVLPVVKSAMTKSLCYAYSGANQSSGSLALANLGRWAASIFDGGKSPGEWLAEGVAILKQECEVALWETKTVTVNCVRVRACSCA